MITLSYINRVHAALVEKTRPMRCIINTSAFVHSYDGVSVALTFHSGYNMMGSLQIPMAVLAFWQDGRIVLSHKQDLDGSELVGPDGKRPTVAAVCKAVLDSFIVPPQPNTPSK